MIANFTELKVAVRNLRIMEQALQSLRSQLEASNPDLLAISVPAYVQRIRALRTEITQYLYEHPDELSEILPPIEVSEVEALAA